MTDEESDIDGGGSGGASLAGYDYQIDVSVWLALDLILASKQASEIILEPASEEDLEAELEEYQPAAVTTRVALNGYTLVVQVKYRTGDAWTARSVKRLLEHGKDTGRQKASVRLNAPEVRYLLVTNAPVNTSAKGLQVRRAGVWPKPADMVALLVAALPAGSAGRVAIIGSEDDERLQADIERLLGESFRVPRANWEACLRILREEAKIRIRQGGGGRWRRAELETVIRRQGGFLASSPQLEHYVHPTNWADLTMAMTTRHAALILGQSGTGKTLATRMIFEELRTGNPGLTRVPITLGPQQLLNDNTPSPVLYDIEDPWGRFDFDPASRPWNDQLAQIFAQATHERMVIATSRLDVARSASALDGVKDYVVGLEAEHYGAAERRQLYRTRIAALPRALQTTARNSEVTVLAELGTPLEIQKFFDALPGLEPEFGGNRERLVGMAIARAHQNSIERTVKEQIEQRDDVRAAAVLWGLLKATDKLSMRLIRDLEDALADQVPEMDEGLDPLVNFLVAARNLRQSDDLVTYYHPRVEAGIEQALKEHAALVRRVLSRLIDVLVSPNGPGPEWGVATAVRLLAAASRRRELKPTPSRTAAIQIDSWLTARLGMSAGADLEEDLRLAAAAGSSTCTVAELSRYLANRPDRSFPGFTYWGPPDHGVDWYLRMRADPLTAPLLKSFVREILPTTRDDFDQRLVPELDRLADGMTPAFLGAAARAVNFGVMSNDDAIAAGALRDLAGFEAIVDAAVSVRTLSDEEKARNAEINLDIINSVYSDDYAQHIGDNDDGYTAGEFLAAYVRAVRETVGWQILADHRHLPSLLWYWLNQLSRDQISPPPTDAEIATAFAAAHGVREADAWFVVKRHWKSQYLSGLVERLEAGADPAVRHAALECVLANDMPAFGTTIATLQGRGADLRLMDLALDLAELAWWAQRSDPPQTLPDEAIARLPPPFDEIAQTELARRARTLIVVGQSATDLLRTTVGGSQDSRLFRVRMDAFVALPIEDDIAWLIEHGDTPEAVIACTEAAVRRNDLATLRRILEHRFAEPAALAMKALAAPLPAPLPDYILDKVKARPSPLRKALVVALRDKPHQDHLPVLMSLAKDTWSSSSRMYGEEDDFPIAQGAIAALADLADLAPLTPEIREALFQIAIDTSDVDVLTAIFDLLALKGGPERQQQLFDLSVAPGRLRIRRAAALALLHAGEVVDNGVVAAITPQLLAGRVEPIAAALTVLLAWRGEPEHVRAVAQALATLMARRVLLLLMAWVLKDLDLPRAQEIAALLPDGHPSIDWVFGPVGVDGTDSLIQDLGDPAACASVLAFINKRKI